MFYLRPLAHVYAFHSHQFTRQHEKPYPIPRTHLDYLHLVRPEILTVVGYRHRCGAVRHWGIHRHEHGDMNLYSERELIAVAVLCLLVGFVGAIGLLA
jgi:hypothetical protein